MSSFGGASGAAGGAGGSFGQIMSGVGAAANNFNQNNRPLTSGSQTKVGQQSTDYSDLEALLEKYFPKKSTAQPMSPSGTPVNYNP